MNIYILYLHNNLKSSMFCKNDLVYMTNAQDYIMYLSCQTFFSFVTMITLKLWSSEVHTHKPSCKVKA